MTAKNVLATIAAVAIAVMFWMYVKFVHIQDHIETNRKLLELAKESALQCVGVVEEFKERQGINRELLIQLHSRLTEFELEAECK